MITATWTIVILAIFVLVAGIVSAIVVKMETVPNWRKVVKVLYWIIGLVLFKFLIWGIYGHYKDGTLSKMTLTKTNPGIQTVQPKEEWVSNWKLPKGKTVRSLNESGPLVTEIIKRDDKNLWINILYVKDDNPEVARIRLTKIGDRSWEGPWEQDNPEDFGRCELHESIPGKLFTGNMTGVAGIPAHIEVNHK